jgi:multiple sugar transport system substrate-binding protein
MRFPMWMAIEPLGEKMRLRTLTAAAVTAAVFSLSLVGLSAQAAQTESGTLRFITPSYPATPEGAAALDRLVKKFNKEYPNIKVEVDLATFGNLPQKMAASAASNQPYDVYVTGIGWIPPFASKGVFADLKQYGVTRNTLAATTSPAIIPAATYKGKVYALPLIIAPRTIALSKKAFKAAGLDPLSPPKTLAQLRAAAIKLTKRDSNGNLVQAGFDFWAKIGELRQQYTALLGTQGVALFGSDGTPRFQGAKGVAMADFIKQLINIDKVTDYAAVTPTGDPMVNVGKAGMGFTGGYIDCAKFGQAVCDDLVYFNLDDKKPAMFTGGQLVSIGAKTKLSKASWYLATLLTSIESESDMAVLNVAVPATKGAEKLPVVAGNPAASFVYSRLDDSVFEGGPANWLEIRGNFGPALDAIVLGKTPAAAGLIKLSRG